MSVPGYRVSLHQTFHHDSTLHCCQPQHQLRPSGAQLTVVWVQSGTRQIIFIWKKDGVFCDPKNRAETLTLTGKKESGSWKWSSGLLFFGRFLELFLQEESHVCNEYFTKKTVYHHSISPWGGDVKTTWKQPPKRTSFGNPEDQKKMGDTWLHLSLKPRLGFNIRPTVPKILSANIHLNRVTLNPSQRPDQVSQIRKLTIEVGTWNILGGLSKNGVPSDHKLD